MVYQNPKLSAECLQTGDHFDTNQLEYGVLSDGCYNSYWWLTPHFYTFTNLFFCTLLGEPNKMPKFLAGDKLKKRKAKAESKEETAE